MPAEPTAQRPNDADPHRSRDFAPLFPLMLPTLLSHPRGTRFASHASTTAPTREASVSLLLSICGYRIRCDVELTMRGASGRWFAVPAPGPRESMIEFLQRICVRDWPARTMDPNDERLDTVFGGAAGAT